MKLFFSAALILMESCVTSFKSTTHWKLSQPGLPGEFTSRAMSEKKTPVTKTEIKEFKPMTLPKIFLPPSVDVYSIGLTLFGQGILINLGFLVSAIYQFLGDNSIGIGGISFDKDSMTTAIRFALPLIISGFIFDRLPLQVAKEISRDTR
jgi:hypothetical protein